MAHDKICLASDNWAPAHPLVMKALEEANVESCPGYGNDPWTEEAVKLIEGSFKRPCRIYMVPSGTGANVLGFKIACRRYESIICSEIAHVQYQESGATESIVGCKLLTVPHQRGKVTPEEVVKILRKERAFGKHSTAPRVLSITQPTEVGTVYTVEELGALARLCEKEKLIFHIDGSRLYNAAAGLKTPLSELVRGVDILSLGGTKNGLIGAEALVIFNPLLFEGSDHLHKQTLQLMSKSRYLSAQYIPFFKNDLWYTLAEQANLKAQQIAASIQKTPQLTLSYPVETNQIFFTAPKAWIPLILERIFCYPWDNEKNEIRFIASWNTTDEEVHAIELLLKELPK